MSSTRLRLWWECPTRYIHFGDQLVRLREHVAAAGADAVRNDIQAVWAADALKDLGVANHGDLDQSNSAVDAIPVKYLVSACCMKTDLGESHYKPAPRRRDPRQLCTEPAPVQPVLSALHKSRQQPVPAVSRVGDGESDKLLLSEQP